MSQACPHCGDTRSRKSSLYLRDGLFKALFYTPYRCRECHHRFWVINPLKPVMLVLLAGLSVAAIGWLKQQGGVPTPSPEAAYSQALERAHKGEAEAELQMGLRYAEGDGVIKNDKEAAKWLEKAARHGLAEAQYHYGLALLQGRGVVQDYKAAFHWIEQPAQRGHSQAQYSLAELYRYGTGTAMDKARAYLWYNLAAAQGVDAAAKARDSLVWQLKPEQLAAMQEEAHRISHGQAVPDAAPASKPAAAQPAP